jgi:hypothetical protein
MVDVRRMVEEGPAGPPRLRTDTSGKNQHDRVANRGVVVDDPADDPPLLTFLEKGPGATDPDGVCLLVGTRSARPRQPELPDLQSGLDLNAVRMQLASDNPREGLLATLGGDVECT